LGLVSSILNYAPVNDSFYYSTFVKTPHAIKWEGYLLKSGTQEASYWENGKQVENCNIYNAKYIMAQVVERITKSWSKKMKIGNS
jgi:hypothetical protein